MSSSLVRFTTFYILLLFSSSSWSFVRSCCPEPYFGADAQLRHITWLSGNGGNIFNKNLPQGNFYVGVKLNGFLGGEMGYQSAPRRHRNVTINPGATILNNVIPNNVSPSVLLTTVSVKGFHANVVGYYPIGCYEGTELFGSIGFVCLNFKQCYVPMSTSFTAVSTNGTRTFNKNRWVPRYGLGVRQMITECVGVRSLLVWEKLTRFQNIPPLTTEVINSSLTVNTRHSLIYSFGFFYYF